MKILITGGSGLLGQYLNLELSKVNDILTMYNNFEGNCLQFNNISADVRDVEKITGIFENFQPDTVVHTAAVTSPHQPDVIPAKDIYAINVNAVKYIAELCKKYSAKLIYTSTDLVYAGYRGSMLKEEAKLIPISLYAETKLMGEEMIKRTFDNYIILRTALLYGFGLHGRRSHFHQMYEDLKQGKRVNLFTDQYRTPLSLFDAARMIAELCKTDIAGETFNFGGMERVSRFELGGILCRKAGFDVNLLEPVTMDSLPGYPAVADVSMDCGKLYSYGIKPQSIEDALDEILNTEREDI